MEVAPVTAPPAQKSASKPKAAKAAKTAKAPVVQATQTSTPPDTPPDTHPDTPLTAPAPEPQPEVATAVAATADAPSTKSKAKGASAKAPTKAPPKAPARKAKVPATAPVAVEPEPAAPAAPTSQPKPALAPKPEPKPVPVPVPTPEHKPEPVPPAKAAPRKKPAAKPTAPLSDSWKTKPAQELSDEEVLAMPEAEYMNDVQLAFFRHKLSRMKADVLSNAGETTEHLREETVIVPDPTDRATIEEEHALELRTRDRERKLLKKIEQSIASIDNGSYGYCEETGEPIGVRRLLARPTASLSLEAQQRRELKQKMFGD
nr:RNA polymerase-binding protein DksA [Candidatus Symbiobacter mobilis]